MIDLSHCRSLLASGNVAERLAAAERLCLAGPDTALAAVELVRACGDDEQVAAHAVSALEEMGPPPVSSGTELIGLMDSEIPSVAYWAATLLGRLKEDGNAYQDALAARLATTSDVAVKQRIAWALGQVGANGPLAIQALKLAASSGDERLSRIAAKALGTAW